MTEFYEFHDSDLIQIEHHTHMLILKMDAYKHVWPDGYDVNSGTGWMQEIEITIDEPVVDVEPTSFPVEIINGNLKSDSIQADPEDFLGNTFEIPASLSGSGDIEISLEGYCDTTSTHESMKIRGKSAAITHKGEARFIEKLPWWNRKDNAESKTRLIGIGEFDSGLPDLATNKKYMEGFGQKSMGRRDKESGAES